MHLAYDLFACPSAIERLAGNGDDFIFTRKEASPKALYDFIEGCEFERHEVKVRKDKPHERHRYGPPRHNENLMRNTRRGGLRIAGGEKAPLRGALASLSTLPVARGRRGG